LLLSGEAALHDHPMVWTPDAVRFVDGAHSAGAVHSACARSPASAPDGVHSDEVGLPDADYSVAAVRSLAARFVFLSYSADEVHCFAKESYCAVKNCCAQCFLAESCYFRNGFPVAELSYLLAALLLDWKQVRDGKGRPLLWRLLHCGR
jgi:hypothetical protein